MNWQSYSTDVFSVRVIDQKVLVVTLSRPKAANSIPPQYHEKLDDVWDAFESDATLRVAIITGEGKFFCAGADLKTWLDTVEGRAVDRPMSRGGFLGLSNRVPKKPYICALNGPAFGGGTEAAVNCDLTVAAKNATLCLPEVRRGVTAQAGALPRIGKLLGLKRAAELALVAEPISADKALEWGLVNKVVDSPQQVLPAALEYAQKIVKGSPEAVAASLVGIRRGTDETNLSSSAATWAGIPQENQRVKGGDNIAEGLKAFKEKREPRWGDFKL
uniref:ARAD1C26334p n=1 Tax=Blastobotrys adeninivorans TaxID=409370 RepID=A0A060T2L8_BLAAD